MINCHKVFELESHPEQVSEVVAKILKLMTDSGVPRKEAFKVSVTAAELLNNIVEHAYDRMSNMPIRLTLRVGRGWVRIQTLDKGVPYPVGLRSRFSDNSAPDGRGVHIMNAWAQSHRYMMTSEGNSHILQTRLQ